MRLNQKLLRLALTTNAWLRAHPLLALGLVALVLLVADEAAARVGGGSSYSGGGRSSGGGSRSSGGYGGRGSGSGGGGGAVAFFSLPWPVQLIIVIIIIAVVISSKNKGGRVSYGGRDDDDDDDGPEIFTMDDPRLTSFRQSLPPSWGERARAVDPAFSEVLFLERAVLLVTRLFQAAPQKEGLSALAPYLVPDVALRLTARHLGIKEVKGVTVGRIAIVAVDAIAGPDGTPALLVRVRLHLNRHVSRGAGDTSFYSHEEWSFLRPVGKGPIDENNLTRFGCPGCGSPLERDSLGRCVHCQTSLAPGAADWTARSTRVLVEENKGPLLTSNVVEVGTDAPTCKDSSVEADAEALLGGVEKARLLTRAREIFVNLQAQWSANKLDGLRPFETDALFQSHRFWVEEYQRQHLRNVVDQLHVSRVELCRVEEDGAHVAAVCRIHASCRDYTVDERTQKRVSGNLAAKRAFTEYWTFVKHKEAKGTPSMANCPSCGAPLKISQTGVCEFCQSKVTLGRFDWVASRIDQDEEISGGD